VNTEGEITAKNSGYDQAHGETDLFEGNLRWKGGTYLLSGLLTFGIIACAVTTLLIGNRFFNNVSPSGNLTATLISTSIVPVTSEGDLSLTTNTPRPTVFLATVTEGPPTEIPSPSPTITPTQGPCSQVVQAGDDLIAIIYRCGHRHFDTIVDEVVATNQLEDASRIQEGQTIEVAWPTTTIDPNAVPGETPTGEAAITLDGTPIVDANGETLMGVRLVPTETLQPGVAWHTVRKDENIIIIAVQYGATLRIMSELNPEVTFSQCDFGLGTGGENCVVQLIEGQQIRVPAPTPTPTIQPTVSGSETATPTATPTFNAPNALSPSNRAFFGMDDLITLRWVATGSLSPDQLYLIQIEDQTNGKSYSATTQDLFFIIPEEWHGNENTRHDYLWTVSVIDTNNPVDPYFTTDARMFTWQGRGN
jgi:hypothetical protein